MATQSAMVLPERFEPALGVSLTEVRPTGGGQGRSCYARLAGQEVVVKWGIDPDLVEKIPYVAGLVEPLTARDCRTPRIGVHGLIGGPARGRDWLGYGWVQERLPGAAAKVLDDGLLADLVALITRLADAPPGAHRNDFGAWVPGVVFEDDAGWWGNAGAMGPGEAAFCERLRDWIGPRSLAEYPAAGVGYVHCDLNLNNILVREGRLSGLVDTEHMGVGDRGLDVARLAFEWCEQASGGVTGVVRDGLARLVAFGLEVSGPYGWRVAVGYELVSRLGWRPDTGATPLPSELPLCETVLDALAGLGGQGVVAAGFQ